jgi:polyhydroxyalkanoate synthesis regulator phasin
MRKLIVIPLATLLLVGAATAALAQTDAGKAVVQAVAGPGTLLGDVLADLVKDGTITQTQADTITKAVDDRRTELQTEREKVEQQVRTFLEDGVITQDELTQLPADHPLRQLTTLMDDGKITLDELRSLGGFGRGMGRGFGFGHHGFMGPDHDTAPDSSPAPSGSSSST